MARRRRAGALAAAPRQRRQVNPNRAPKQMRKGALGNLPRLENRANRLQRRIDQRAAAGKGYGKAQAKLDKVNARIGAMGQEPGTTMTVPPQTGGGMMNPTVSNDMGNPNLEQDFYQSPWGPVAGIFDNVQGQGQFDPSSYQMAFQQQRDAATDRVMQQFDRQMNPRFEQEQAQFEQRMAEQGIPKGSELYDRQYSQMKETQNAARQNAMDQAYQTGAAEQSQAFGQAYQGYQLPTQQAAALSPYYNAYLQNQQFGQNLGFQENQNALDRTHQSDMARAQFEYNKKLAAQGNKFALQQIASTPRGGGGGGSPGLTYDQRIGLMDHEFYNNLALAGMQNGQSGPLPSTGSGIAQGLSQGIGLGLAGALA